MMTAEVKFFFNFLQDEDEEDTVDEMQKKPTDEPTATSDSVTEPGEEKKDSVVCEEPVTEIAELKKAESAPEIKPIPEPQTTQEIAPLGAIQNTPVEYLTTTSKEDKLKIPDPQPEKTRVSKAITHRSPEKQSESKRRSLIQPENGGTHQHKHHNKHHKKSSVDKADTKGKKANRSSEKLSKEQATIPATTPETKVTATTPETIATATTPETKEQKS